MVTTVGDKVDLSSPVLPEIGLGLAYEGLVLGYPKTESLFKFMHRLFQH